MKDKYKEFDTEESDIQKAIESLLRIAAQQEIEKRNAAICSDKTGLEETIKALKEELVRTTKLLEEKVVDTTGIFRAYGAQKVEIAELKLAIETLTEENSYLRTKVGKTTYEANLKNHQIMSAVAADKAAANSEEQILTLVHEIESRKTLIDTLYNQLHESRDTVAKLRQEITQTREELNRRTKTYTDSNDFLQKELEKSRFKIEEAKGLLKEAKENEVKVVKSREFTTMQRNNLRLDNEDLRKENLHLQGQVAALTAFCEGKSNPEEKQLRQTISDLLEARNRLLEKNQHLAIEATTVGANNRGLANAYGRERVKVERLERELTEERRARYDSGILTPEHTTPWTEIGAVIILTALSLLGIWKIVELIIM